MNASNMCVRACVVGGGAHIRGLDRQSPHQVNLKFDVKQERKVNANHVHADVYTCIFKVCFT
jgi:actin-like ATPase involved in cell morphogenesis